MSAPLRHSRDAVTVLAATASAHSGAGVAESEARDRIAPRAGTIRGRLLVLLAARGEMGLTATEATELYTAQHGGRSGLYSIAPRLSELTAEGYAAQSGSYRRPEPDAPRREVYIATDLSRAWARTNGDTQ